MSIKSKKCPCPLPMTEDNGLKLLHFNSSIFHPINSFLSAIASAVLAVITYTNKKTNRAQKLAYTDKDTALSSYVSLLQSRIHDASNKGKKILFY